MKTARSFTFTNKELAQIVMDWLQAGGQLPKSSTGGYNVKTEFDSPYPFGNMKMSKGYNVTYIFEE
jgi:hypothetical protein